MPSSSTTNIKNGIILLFFSLAFFYFVFIIKIPVICNGCDPLVGLWYRCVAGTGIGTPTCSIEQGEIFGLKVDLAELTSIIQSSGLVTLPREWLQTLTNVWLSIKSFGQSLIDQTISLYGYIKTQFGIIVRDYIIGYPKAGYEAFKDNVIIPLISGVTNYIINPVKSLILNVIEFKNTALSVFNSVVSTVKGVGGTIYEYTYGFLVDGFDQVPYGLVLFVEGIQYILNQLKHGIIYGANYALGGVTDVLSFIADNILEFGKMAVSGTYTTVNTISGGLEGAINFMIDNVINKVVGGLNSAVTFDLGTPVRSGINTLIGFINIAYDSVIGAVVNPLIGVVDTVQRGVISAVNAVSDFDLTGWIPPIDIGVTTIDIPSFKPFSFLGNPTPSTMSTLSGRLVDPLGPNQIPAGSLSSFLGIPQIGTVSDISLPIPDFATSTNQTITGWQVETTSTLSTVRIDEPSDLFWAGTRSAPGPQGDVCANIANAYPLEVDEDGKPTKTYANTPGSHIYDQFNTSTCLFSSSNSVDNRYIGTSSCSDICYSSGKSSIDTNDIASPNCDRQFPLYGTPEQSSIPKLTTPEGLTYYLYRGQPMVYYAPCLYKVNITVNEQSYTTSGGKRNYTVDEGGMITIYDPDKSKYAKVQNGGYKNISTGRYYTTEKDLSIPGPIKAWEYFVNVLTDDKTSCNLEYLLSDSPENLGIQSITTDTGLTVYYINDKPYIYLNPKLYRVNLTSLTAVSAEQLVGSSSAYSFAIPYTDDKSNQIAIKYIQTGYAYNPSDVVELPTQFVNNVAVALTPEQSGFTSRTLGTLFYYVNSNGKPYTYDRSKGKMFGLDLSNMDFITGTPESNGYTKDDIGYRKGNYYRTFAVTEQTQYYVVLRKRGYVIDPSQRAMLPYTITDDVITYKTPSESGYAIQPTDGYGLIYYSKSGKNYVYDQKGNAMVPLVSMTPSEQIYGQPEDSGYQTRIFGYEKNSTNFYFIAEQRFLVEYYSKSLFSPSCGCTSSFIVTKTCKDFCASKYDSSNSPYGCDDGQTSQNTGGYSCSDSRVTDFSKCACTEQGPVNVIVKPMKKYNPFRLLQQGISAGVGELSNLIKYSVQSFLTPVWNAIKSIFQFIASMVVTAIQFIYNFLFGGESSPIWIQIKEFIGSLQQGFKQYVIDDFVNGIIIDGIKSIIPTRSQIMTILQPVLDILYVAFDAMLTAFKYTFEALKTAATFLFKNVIVMLFYYILYVFSTFSDIFLFFLPLNRTGKMVVLFTLLILLFIKGYAPADLVVTILGYIVNIFVSIITRTMATAIDIVFNF
jgi:hypothetical protein